jgi:cellulose synthase/poly-beta-1,6-N-acetylglucosamine synthase-like glycosyltransferase
MLGILIDSGTFLVRRFRPKKREMRDIKDMTVSAILPLYNEEGTLEDGVKALTSQTEPVKNIYLLDDCSTDGTEAIGRRMQELYPDQVVYCRMAQNGGKGRNINDLVENTYFDLGDLIFISDGDCIPLPDCIQMLKRKFSDKSVVAVTGMPIMYETGNLFNRIIVKGKIWMVNCMNFRKTAQCERDSMAVLCGAICMYDKRIMKKHPLPIRTVTEDLDHTWMLIEDGYRLEFERDAYTVNPDITNLRSQWAQAYRWNKGFWQAFYFHVLDKRLDKSRMLKYTVIYVGFLDFVLLLFRYLVIIALAITGDIFLLLLLAGEMIMYLIPGITFFGIRGLVYLPFNYVYQMLMLVTFLCSGCEVTRDYLRGNILSWNNRWSKDYGNRSVILDGSIAIG